MQERFKWFVEDGDGNNDADTKKKAHISAFWESIKRNSSTQVSENNQKSSQLHVQIFLRQGGVTHFGDFR